jgi:hypothetical protein
VATEDGERGASDDVERAGEGAADVPPGGGVSPQWVGGDRVDFLGDATVSVSVPPGSVSVPHGAILSRTGDVPLHLVRGDTFDFIGDAPVSVSVPPGSLSVPHGVVLSRKAIDVSVISLCSAQAVDINNWWRRGCDGCA